LGQSLNGLKSKISIYHKAWNDAGHPGRGVVTLMLHAFVGDNDDAVHEIVREPMKAYLAGSLNLAAANIESVAFLKEPEKIDVGALTDDDVDDALEASFEKYFHMSGLFGSYEKCLDMVDQVEQADVDEIACLIDFGVEPDTVLQSLEKLNVVRILSNSE
jgi:natural product biosynthesis luciferase-like monooxygenase protein